MEIRRQAHCVYRCMYHIVWIPRYRYQILVNGVDEYLKIKMDEIRKRYPEIEYIERNVQPDHVHMVISFPPQYSIARVVQLLKQNTGRAVGGSISGCGSAMGEVVGYGRLGISRAQWAWMRRRSAATFGIRRKKTWDKRSLHSEKSPGRKSGEIYWRATGTRELPYLTLPPSRGKKSKMRAVSACIWRKRYSRRRPLPVP